MEYQKYIRKPFVVEAVEITEDNVEEVAAFIGQVIYDDHDQVIYIEVDRSLVPGISRAYVGYFMTKMGDHTRVYSPRVFYKQFARHNDDIQKWVDFLEKVSPEGTA